MIRIRINQSSEQQLGIAAQLDNSFHLIQKKLPSMSLHGDTVSVAKFIKHKAYQ
jgi:hypothetical protein